MARRSACTKRTPQDRGARAGAGQHQHLQNAQYCVGAKPIREKYLAAEAWATPRAEIKVEHVAAPLRI